jgi:hypothetical protein
MTDIINIIKLEDLENLNLIFSSKQQKAKLKFDNKLKYLKINNIKLGDSVLKTNNAYYVDLILNNEIHDKIAMFDDFILNNIELQNRWNIGGNIQVAYEYSTLIKSSSIYINEYCLKLKSDNIEFFDQYNNNISYLLLKRNMKCNLLLEIGEIYRENEKIIFNLKPIQIKTNINLETEEYLNIGYQLKSDSEYSEISDSEI